MPKGIGIMIGPAKGQSMYDDDESEPESKRSGSSRGLDNLRTLLGDADEEQLEAFKDLVRECFDEYEREPHDEAPHDED